MPVSLHKRRPIRLFPAAIPFALFSASVAGGSDAPADPLRFFEGRTEYVSTMKLVMKKPYTSRTLGQGEIRSDGSLHLVQKVQDEGKPAYQRQWRVRRVGPGLYAGTMNQAKGPITVDEVDGRYRFRFKMQGHLSVEQWLTPNPGGQTAHSRLTVRKLGLVVGRSEGSIRRL